MSVHAFSSVTDLEVGSEADLIPGPIDHTLVLASTSATLRRLIEAAGLAIRVAPVDHSEMQTLQGVLKEMSDPEPSDVAELHVRIKIDEASHRYPGALVIGAQQVVSLDGKLCETPRTIHAARDLLLELRGKTHQLHSAVALAREGEIVWSSVETAHLSMRNLSAQFVGRYLIAAEVQAVGYPGAYQLDGIGLQLFDDVEGAYPAVFGAPIFGLFARMRELGAMVT